MSYDHQKLIDTVDITKADSGKSFDSFASYVSGKTGKSFGNIFATGSITAAYNVQIDPGYSGVISIDKTTEENQGTINIAASEDFLDAASAALMPSDSNLRIISDIYGKEYKILPSSSYLYVNSSTFKYNLNNAQSAEAFELYEELRNLLGSESWKTIWEKNLTLAKAAGAKDIVAYIAENGTDDIKPLLNQCKDILGEIPISTFALNVRQESTLSSSAPVINAVTNYNIGDKVRITIDAVDNILVKNWYLNISNADTGEVVARESQITTASIDISGIEKGRYEINVMAYDNTDNMGSGVFFIDVKGNDVSIDSATLKEENVPVAITDPNQEAKAGEEVTYNITVEYSGEYTFNFTKLGLKDKLTLKIVEIETDASGAVIKKRSIYNKPLRGSRSATALLDNSKKYSVTVISNSKESTVFELQAAAEFFDRANQVAADNITDYKKKTAAELSAEVTEEMRFTVSAKNDAIIGTAANKEWVGFSDSCDIREMVVANAGKYTFDLYASDQTKFTIYSVNKNGKLKSLKTISVGKDGGAKSSPVMLLESGTYYVAIESPNAAKGGRSDYYVKLNESTAIYDNVNAKPQTGDVAFNFATGVNDWVGFGNSSDTFSFTTVNGGAYTFNLGDSLTPLKLTIMEDNGTKFKAIKTFKAKKGYVSVAPLLLKGGTKYQLVVTSTKAKSGTGSEYSLTGSSVEFNPANNTIDTASDAVATGSWHGVLSMVNNGDAVDFLKITGANGGQIKVSSGRVNLSFFDKDKNQISASSLDFGKKDSYILKAGKDGIIDISTLAGVDYIKAEAMDKKINQYAITLV